jgi:thiamine-monophosphate kinase
MESEFLNWLDGKLPANALQELGPGDDAAVLRLHDQARCVITSDMLSDGVDFVLDECDWTRIGRKALAVNLSDLAAMAAQPVAALISLMLPCTQAPDLARQLVQGLIPLAQEFDVAIAGGDTNTWAGGLVISITAIGVATEHGLLRRDGAHVGDQILASGQFGGSILGKHFDFTPRVSEALLLNARYDIHAATDVSDGLSLDLSHIADASGCGALIRTDRVPIAEAAHQCAKLQPGPSSALDHALSDGEDFELLLAVPPEEADRILADQPLDVPLTRIGEFIARPGLWEHTGAGEPQPLEPRGYVH